MLKIYNTLSRKLEDVSVKDKVVRIYNCGPTVYMKMHVGNLRAFVVWDVFHRALKYLGYDVKRIMNITDVGHMTGDEDFGEDKVDRLAETSGKEPMHIANGYIQTVLDDFRRMNISSPSGKEVTEDVKVEEVGEYGWTRATLYIQEMIELIKKMQERGFAYETELAVYFDVSKFPEYSKMSGQSLSEKKDVARSTVVIDKNKRNRADFVLWMKKAGKYENHKMNWDSPWGVGFPGWHIECSAMGIKELGEEIDIHTGGIDAISVHHANERAQNYGATGKEVVRIWAHNEFISTNLGEKLSKSAGNALTLDEIVEMGISPLDLRYFFAINNYRVPLSFNMEALNNAKKARASLMSKIGKMKGRAKGDGDILEGYKKRFSEALENDMNVSVAFAMIHELLKSKESPKDIISTISDFDKVFALDLMKDQEIEIPENIKELLAKRKKARELKEYALSDKLRAEIEGLGYTLLDTSKGQEIKRK